MSTVGNVTQGKPKSGGAVYRAWLSANPTIPTDATTALGDAFKEVGFISEDGLSNSNSPDSEEVKAWGGTVVLNPQTGKPDEWTFTMIEFKNIEMLKTVYGEANVTGAFETGVDVAASDAEAAEACWVFEQVLRGGTLCRTVIMDGKITEIGDVSYVDDEPIGYEVTVSAYPDSTGKTHHKYLIDP